MTPRTTAQAFADATSALVEDDDVPDILDRLLRDCAALIDADAIGLLVMDGAGRLELLSATSHRATELELFQVQHNKGPCVDAINRAEVVSMTTEADLRTCWDEVGPAIADAGFCAVHAFPMRWRGRVIGGLNVFKAASGDPDDDRLMLGQAFADVATVVTLQAVDIPAEDVTARIHQAIAARTIIEQAKGVLAHQHTLDMADAYELLVEIARRGDSPITGTAAAIVHRAHHGP
jgi:transcriptional regulator with GAF, ATPase, and Fis domain